MKLIAPFGILESARTGMRARASPPERTADRSRPGLMALPRSPLHGSADEVEREAADVVDVSTLPPG